MTNLITLLYTGLGSAISAFIAWFFTRSKYKTEVDGAKIANFDSSINAYKKMYEDMIGDLKEQNRDLVGQKEDLKKEISSLKEELSETRKQVIVLTNFVLASALKRADENLDENTLNALKDIIK